MRFTKLLEYIIRTDFSAGFVELGLYNFIASLIDKWFLKESILNNKALEDLKIDIVFELRERLPYLTDEYLRLHSSGKLLFKNDSWGAGCKLREELRPNTLNVRNNLKKLLDSLFMY
ncbi:hypothetical protein [Clostridium tagluense]|uniref:hypothetical protein n=1 Tax=Clostridium tagluense TaxID=360422 RepID=UPI001C0D8B5E|nr:hypothetical protein [Clostridium tagluense]MBU3130538.1 hypothetical protein [Clostridium tagluense]